MIYSEPNRKNLAAHFAISAHDLPTRDKIPVIKTIMGDDGEGLALDLGSGTGFTTYAVFGDRPTVCVDLYAPNLQYYRNKIALVSSSHKPLCVAARVTELPFKTGVFRFALCSEVLEHLENDDGAARELAWVLAIDGRVVITVPHSKWGFASFLELLGVKTVHDAPGPEHHFRVGYTEKTLGKLLRQYGLHAENRHYYLRLFTRLATDLISLGNLLVQRFAYHRTTWNWAEVAELENSWVFRFYTWIFPLLWFFTRLDRLLLWMPGFGLIVAVRKREKSLNMCESPALDRSC
jgi:SAM-dependent methyltransferase